MSFKRRIGLSAKVLSVFAAGLLLSFNACGSRNPPSSIEATSLGIDENEIGCLSKASETIDHYLDGKASPEEVPALKNCAVKALQVFGKLTQGTKADRYSARELGSFLERYYLDNTKLSDAFLAQAMKIKRVLLGGSVESITRAELDRAMVMLTEISNQLVNLQPFMPWNVDAFLKLPAEKFALLRQTLVQVGLDLGSFLKNSGQEWKFAEIPELLRSFKEFPNGEGFEAFAKEVEDKLPLIERLKRMCLGPKGEGVEAAEWPRFLSTTMQWYSLWLQILYVDERVPFFTQFDRYAISDSWMSAFEEALGLVNDSLSRQEKNRIPIEDLIVTVDEIQAQFKGPSIRTVFEQAWNLKMQIWGGDAEAFVSADIQSLRNWVHFAQQLLPRLGQLRPYSFEAYENLSPKEFQVITQRFTSMGHDVASFLRNSPGTISAPQLIDLIRAWCEYFKLPTSKNVEIFEINFDLFKRFKRTLIGYEPDRIQSGEWETTLKRATNWYVLFLRTLYWQKLDPLGSSLANYKLSGEWVSLMELGLTYLREATENHPLSTLHFDEIESLIEGLVEGNGATQTKRFLQDALLLKRALMGGSAAALVPEDYRKLSEFIQFAAKTIPTFRDILPLDFDSIGSLDFEDLDRRTTQLTSMVGELGAFIQKYGTGYSWKEAMSLIESAGQYMEVSAHQLTDLLDSIEKNLPMIRLVKYLLLASNADGIATGEWKDFLELGSKGYGLMLKAHYYGIKKGDLQRTPGLLWAQNIMEGALGELKSAAKHHPGSVLKFEDIDAILREVFPKNVAVSEDSIKTQTLLDLYHRLFKGILSGTDTTITGRKAKGVTLAHLDRLQFSWLRWSEGQRFAERLFKKLGGVGGSYTAEQLLSHSIESVFGVPDTVLSPVSLDAAKFVRWILKDGGRGKLHRPLFQRPDDIMFFPEGQWNFAISYFDMSQSLWGHEIVRLLTAGYTERDLDSKAQFRDLNLAEATHFYNDIAQAALELHVTDPSLKTVVSNRFIESNLFVYSANGDQYIDQAEGVELFAFLLSGKGQSSNVHEEIYKRCPKTGQVDFYLKPKIEVGCYRNQFYGRIEHYLSNLPAFVKYYRGLSEKEQGLFIRTYEIAARKTPQAPMMISDDTDGLVTLAQYAEALYVRIDKNRDAILDWDEARAAYPYFKRILADFAGTSDDNWLEPAFYFMLKNGRQPSKPELLWWKIWMNSQKMDSDRGKLMGIIAEISMANGEAKAASKIGTMKREAEEIYNPAKRR